MKGRIANPLIQELLTHWSKQKPIDISVKGLIRTFVHRKDIT